MGRVSVLMLEDSCTLGSSGPQGSSYLTREDIHAILFEAKKMESVVYGDTKPSYLEEITGKPYLANYTPPIFPKYDGITGNTREHIKRYVDTLTAHTHDHEPRFREFSKSLEGRAFTWCGFFFFFFFFIAHRPK